MDEDILLPSNELQEVIVKAVAYKSRTCRHLVSSSAVQFCAGVDNGGKGKDEMNARKLNFLS